MQTKVREPAPANDNAFRFGAPLVRTSRRREKALYACSANVILPLRFAQRMSGWDALGASKG